MVFAIRRIRLWESRLSASSAERHQVHLRITRPANEPLIIVQNTSLAKLPISGARTDSLTAYSVKHGF